MAVIRQRLGKYVPPAKHAHSTTELVFYAVLAEVRSQLPSGHSMLLKVSNRRGRDSGIAEACSTQWRNEIYTNSLSQYVKIGHETM
jgi:hypothetical protein